MNEWIFLGSDFPPKSAPQPNDCDPCTKLRLGHHRPSINRQSLDGQLKHIESGWESDCYCHRTQPNILTYPNLNTMNEWSKHFIEYFLPLQTPLSSWPLGIWYGHLRIKVFNATRHPMRGKGKVWDCPAEPFLPLLFHSPLDPWEITLNPNFLRRPVCYSCLENPSLSST